MNDIRCLTNYSMSQQTSENIKELLLCIGIDILYITILIYTSLLDLLQLLLTHLLQFIGIPNLRITSTPLFYCLDLHGLDLILLSTSSSLLNLLTFLLHSQIPILTIYSFFFNTRFDQTLL